MSCRKKLKELTIKDNFMFGAVMSMEDNCRQFLELVMKLRIGEICISSEKSILFHPEYRDKGPGHRKASGDYDYRKLKFV